MWKILSVEPSRHGLEVTFADIGLYDEIIKQYTGIFTTVKTTATMQPKQQIA